MNSPSFDRALTVKAATEPAGPSLDSVFHGIARLAAIACGTRFASIVVNDAGECCCTTAAGLPADPARPEAWLFEVPLGTAEGARLGSLAVYDTETRTLGPEQRAALALLAEQAVAQIELRSQTAELALLCNAQPAAAGAPAAAATAKALLESAPVAIYHTDSAGNMTYSNPEYRRMFGLELGHSPDAWARRVHPDDRARMEQVWAEFCRHPRPSRFESYRTRSDDGLIRHISEQVVPADGVDGWVGTIADFTDLVAARDNLRRAEILFRNTFDQAPLGIVYAERSGQFLRFNQAFAAMLGFDAADLAGKTMLDLICAEDVARVSAQIEQLWSGALQFVDLEKRFIRKDGSILWVRTTTSLLRDAAAAEHSVEFLRDITARKGSAEELERVHKQLVTASRQAGMAEVATNVLHNVGNILNSVNISASLVIERVKQSKGPGVSRVAALLKEQGSAVADFIAHDERGKRIPEYLTSLGEQLLGDQKMALEELASLRDNLEHIKDTVAMQQSYAKLCGVTETIAVAELVEDSLRLNAGAFVRHGVTLCREFGEVPPVTVDKHKVLQILVNLVRNAKYACDESGRADKLLTLRIEKAPAGVRICVIDNGVGIPAENMSRLFTHGFTTRVDGHGFGLHSGALAAQELGGSLRVMSDGPGCGATFILELPVGAAEAAHV
jgi:PAS domain S-box-containing protein